MVELFLIKIVCPGRKTNIGKQPLNRFLIYADNLKNQIS